MPRAEYQVRDPGHAHGPIYERTNATTNPPNCGGQAIRIRGPPERGAGRRLQGGLQVIHARASAAGMFGLLLIRGVAR